MSLGNVHQVCGVSRPNPPVPTWRAAESFDMLRYNGMSIRTALQTARTTTIADVARAGGRLGADRVQGHQRAVRRRGGDASTGGGGHPRARVSAAGERRHGGAPILELIFHELESEWALEIVRGVERVAGQQHLAVVLSEMQGRRTPVAAGSRAPRPTAHGRHRGVLGPEPTRCATSSGRARSRSSSSTRPASRSTTRRRSGRRTGTADWPRRGTCWDSATAASGSSAGLTASCAAGRGSTAIGRRWTRPGCRSTPASSATAGSRSTRGSSGAARCFALPDRPTAIFAGNDLQALGVYQAAREARLHIPEDLSVVGFDDLPVAQLGGAAADDGPPAAGRDGRGGRRAGTRDGPRRGPAQTRVELATELIVRESTARRRPDCDAGVAA